MKKILYLILTVCFISNLSAQIINFPDSNLKTRLLLAANGNGIAYHNGNSLKIDSNNDNEIEVSEALLVNDLVLYNCGISNLSGLEFFINLKHLNCGNNTISNLDLTPFANLIGFDAYNNSLTSLNISNLPHLTNFSCNNNQITTISLSNLPNLFVIRCNNNQLTTLGVNNITNLSNLYCNNNLLNTLDTNNLTHLTNLNCSSNNLTTLYLKNDSNESSLNLDFSNNTNLQYVCADDFQLTQVQDKITQYGYTNCFTNSYCAFVSGGSFYNINGSIKYDEANDGCDAFDIAYPNLKLALSNVTSTGNVFGNNAGNYDYNVQDGTHTIQPIMDNPTYFNVFPSSINVSFPTQASPYSQNFCITPNGLHPDLDISISQIDYDFTALPGSNNTYKISYKNKGTNTQSGTISFNFNDAILDYSDSNPNIFSQAANTLLWNFTNLKPFESKEILVTFHFNSNTDLPSVNEGDLITFTTSINTTSIDDTPIDNTFTLNQVASNIILLSKPSNSIDKYFILYPNPTSNYLNIETKDTIEKKSIKVYNITGQLLLNISKAENISSIDVTNLKTGNYFIVIQTDKGIYKSKFIKN